MAKVYSTETGRLCPGCEQPVDSCRCRSSSGAAPAGDGVVRISRETKGRKGAGVTLVSGLTQDGSSLKTTAKQLKTLCSSGGSVKDGVIEIQGDHREKIKSWCDKQGINCKLAGG